MHLKIFVLGNSVLKGAFKSICQSREFRLAGEASDTENAEKAIVRCKPAAILTETHLLRNASPAFWETTKRLRILAVAFHTPGLEDYSGLKHRVDGIISAACPAWEALVECGLKKVIAGERFFCPSLPPHNHSRRPVFTRREIDVLIALGEGLPAKAIGEKLGISKNTVAEVKRKLCLKTGQHNAAGLLQVWNDFREGQEAPGKRVQSSPKTHDCRPPMNFRYFEN